MFTLDFEKQHVQQRVDWNTGDIDFSGRGADRGLRGISFDGDDIFIAASDELFCYNRNFEIQYSVRNHYLKHCHEISRLDRMLFLSSTGFDSLLAFDLDKKEFVWGFHLQHPVTGWGGFNFDPRGDRGPQRVNDLHINMVHVDKSGLYASGLHTQALLRINNDNTVTEVCSLPRGAHNARPFNQGVVLNDTASDCVRVVARDGKQLAFPIKHYEADDILLAGVDDSKVARQGFGRGLCIIDEHLIAGGSSPSTISLYDIANNRVLASVNLTMDIRNAIHGLEVWPFS